MKKLFSVLLVMIIVVSIFAACGGKKNDDGDMADPGTEDQTENSMAELKDGKYTDEEADFDPKSGWKDNVSIEVKDGKIVDVDWNSTSEEEDRDKKTVSREGDYGMVEMGNASSEWYEQAEKVEDFLIEKQDPNAITLNDDGTTDAIAGVTINVNGFVDLVKGALEGAK